VVEVRKRLNHREHRVTQRISQRDFPSLKMGESMKNEEVA